MFSSVGFFVLTEFFKWGGVLGATGRDIAGGEVDVLFVDFAGSEGSQHTVNYR